MPNITRPNITRLFITRPNITRLFLVVLAAALIAAACGSDDTDPTATGPDGNAEATGEIMAAAAHQLVTVDHTFGSGPPPFTEYLIQRSLDPAAGTAGARDGASLRALSAAEQAAVEGRIAPLGPVTWIDDPDQYISEELSPTIDGAVIIGLGEPVIEGATALAPVSLWCGGLCGTWLTYELELDAAGNWVVIGIDGPVAIS